MTLLYKLTHSLQIVFVLAFVCLLLGFCDRARCGTQLLLLLLPVLMLIGAASMSSQQLGIRYVLPVLPLLMIFASQSGGWIETWRPRYRSLAWCLIAAGCLFSLRHHPHHLAYFNEAAGGPIGGRQHLLDSNLDWGQDLNLVKAFMDHEGLDDIQLVYFGTLWPERLGISYEVPFGRELKPGWYAVSVNYVMGRPHVVHLPDGSSRAVDFHEYAFFRKIAPVETLGGSIDVYHISGDDVAHPGGRLQPQPGL